MSRQAKDQDLAGRTIVITGGSSGIGAASAHTLAAQGAKVVLASRRKAELQQVCREIRDQGGQAAYLPVDLNDFDALDVFAAKVLDEHGPIHVLVNNAGRSIRRPIGDSLERFHDFERCMRLNYFAPVRLSLKLLPSMIEAGDGHIINVLTWGTLLPSPRFAAYVASKCALDGFSQSLATELPEQGVALTTIHYPIVRTPMIAPTKHYQRMPGMSPEQAADWVLKAVRTRQARIAPRFALLAGLNAYLFPGLAQRMAGKVPL